MNSENIIGKRINAALALHNIKQKDLAAHLNVTDNTISYFCSGKRMPNTSQIIQIAKFLGVSADWLLGLSDVQSTDQATKELCQTLGLSENAVETILNCHREEKENDLPDSSEMVSRIIENENFWRIVLDFMVATEYKDFLDSNPAYLRKALVENQPVPKTMSDINKQLFSLISIRGIDSLFKQELSEDVWRMFDEVVKNEYENP